MATSHQAFPSRPYTSGLARGGGGGGGGLGVGASSTPYNAQGAYGAPQQTQQPQVPPQASQQQREAQRLERERAERLDRERREAEEREALDALNEEQREEINEAFSLFDLDKDAHIDYHELKVALKALGFEVAKSELLAMLSAHGVPASVLAAGGAHSKVPILPQQQPTFSGPSRLLLSQASFTAIAAQKVHTRDPRQEILRAFELFDADNKGRIELQDLRRVARELGEGLQEEELQAMIDEFDIRGEGGIDREEFVGICMGG